MTIFEGTERQTTKMNITFLEGGNGVPNTIFKIFSQKTLYRLTKTRKTSLGSSFFPVSVVLLDRSFQKTIGFTHEWTRTNRVNFIKIDSKLQPVS